MQNVSLMLRLKPGLVSLQFPLLLRRGGVFFCVQKSSMIIGVAFVKDEEICDMFCSATWVRRSSLRGTSKTLCTSILIMSCNQIHLIPLTTPISVDDCSTQKPQFTIPWPQNHAPVTSLCIRDAPSLGPASYKAEQHFPLPKPSTVHALKPYAMSYLLWTSLKKLLPFLVLILLHQKQRYYANCSVATPVPVNSFAYYQNSIPAQNTSTQNSITFESTLLVDKFQYNKLQLTSKLQMILQPNLSLPFYSQSSESS